MQLILFEVEQQKFGFDMSRMKEINRRMPITPVPNAPFYFEGITNLRGIIVPIINLRKRLSIAGTDVSLNNKCRIIILEMSGELIGFIVDRVNGVIRVEEEQILEYEGTGIKREAIRGVVKLQSGMITLLELERLV
ncbi:MAG: chemotaxis protein CheW [Candidatus Aureabacteria bacterium]|nr:chemotaxis protein CheW [Candidatus Auribacterota bacterium]